MSEIVVDVDYKSNGVVEIRVLMEYRSVIAEAEVAPLIRDASRSMEDESSLEVYETVIKESLIGTKDEVNILKDARRITLVVRVNREKIAPPLIVDFEKEDSVEKKAEKIAHSIVAVIRDFAQKRA